MGKKVTNLSKLQKQVQIMPAGNSKPICILSDNKSAGQVSHVREWSGYSQIL